MSQKEVHYEVYRRQGAKGAWVLHDASNARDKALEIAAELMASEKATGVKVVKETYDGDTGDYLSLKIFEDGHTKMKVEQAAEDVPEVLPCFKPDDLYSYHSRATLTRLLREFLARNKLTVTELIHRADCLEKLEATGTTYQHAVQKIAVAQASPTMPVQKIIKTLNDLATKAINRVYRDDRRKYFPLTKPGGFGPLAEKLSNQSDGAYVFNAAVALHLAPCTNWNEKLMALLGIMGEAPAEGPGRTLLLGSVDTLIAEILGGSAALQELIGESENLGQALVALVDLFLGQTPADETRRSGLIALAEQFSAGGLLSARTAIANRIIAELKSTRRLCPNSLLDEMKLLRKIANRLVLGDARFLSHENLIAAFTLRSGRLVSNESIAENLADLPDPGAKVERLLQIEENIIGGENKRLLGSFLQHILSTPEFEAFFVQAGTPVMTRLKRLAELQARVRRSNFQEVQRRDFADRLDRIAHDLEQRSKILKSLQESLPGPAEAALAILRLCANNVLTEGRLTAKAREIVLVSVGQPGFLAGYLAQVKSTAGTETHDPERAIADLVQLLSCAGISRETGLKSIAA
jgi:hypothetical protein